MADQPDNHPHRDHPDRETDLRAALQTLVPDDLDVQDFRTRLDALIADRARPAQPAADADDIDVPLQLAQATPLRRRRNARAALLATIAACAAAVVAVAIAVVPNGHDRHGPPATRPTLPASVRSLANPGSAALGTYAGTGTRTFVIAPRTLPAHTGYSAYGTCRGGGTLGISRQTLFGACTGGQFGTGGAVDDGRLVVRAGAHTSWRLTLVIEPSSRTNGSVQSPADPDLTGPDDEVRQTGRGTVTARFQGDLPTSETYRVRLVCHGTGVSLPGLATTGADVPAVHGLSTRTCFAGREYVWTYVRLTTPADVRVVAAPGTTWTVALDSM